MSHRCPWCGEHSHVKDCDLCWIDGELDPDPECPLCDGFGEYEYCHKGWGPE